MVQIRTTAHGGVYPATLPGNRNLSSTESMIDEGRIAEVRTKLQSTGQALDRVIYRD